MMNDLPSKPISIDKINSEQPVEPSGQNTIVGNQNFASFMNTPDVNPQTSATKTEMTSPAELASKQQISPGTPPTIQNVQSQITNISSSLGDVKNQLNQKGLQLDRSQKYLIRNKLSTANEYIRSASKKTDVETGPPVNLNGQGNPISKFLTLVTDGQNQLNSAAEQLKKLSSDGKLINPAALMLIQIKLQKAQQELDYTSVLLGKAVDTMKQLFNIQI